jgi:GT2 family glycosyltransferase
MRDNRRENAQACIDVIIVNWNAGHQLRECIESFTAVAQDRVTLSRIVVVDNGSTDGSLEPLKDLLGSLPLTLLRNLENRGFAAACNQGSIGSTADVLLFLNPDTRLSAGCLENPVVFFNATGNESVGIVGVQLVNAAGDVARSCARRPTAAAMIGQSFGLDRLLPSRFRPHFLSEWPHDMTRTVDQVMGAFCMIRRSLFESLDGFDERFFVYFEDLDFALRARALGWTSVYLTTAKAFHRGHGTTDAVKARRLFYFCRSRILFAFKHLPRAAAIAVAATVVLAEPITRTLAVVIRGQAGEVLNIVYGFGMLWAELPNMLHAQKLGRC